MEAATSEQTFQETQEQLQEISEVKSHFDEMKGKTLDEYSKVVTELHQSIKQQKVKLAPLMKELRQLRQQAQELDVRWSEKKSIFESATLGIQRYPPIV